MIVHLVHSVPMALPFLYDKRLCVPAKPFFAINTPFDILALTAREINQKETFKNNIIRIHIYFSRPVSYACWGSI